MTEKDQIRAIMKQKRRQLSREDRERYSGRIVQRVLEIEAIQKAKRLFLYLSFDGEVETRELIAWCFSQKKEVFVPVVGNNGKMDAWQIAKETRWSKNRYGILEPCQENPPKDPLDLAIVPGLAFDERRFRMGYGAGYYDRYFAKYPEIYRIGLAYEDQILPRVPTEEHDRPMNQIVTENRIL